MGIFNILLLIAVFLGSSAQNDFNLPKRNKKSELFRKNKYNDKNSMEWREDDDNDRRSVDRFSWIGAHDLEKSKSDSSITAIGDCNYRTRGIQASLETCDVQKKLVSALRNFDINVDDDESEERQTSFVPVITESSPYNQFDSNSLHYEFKTQNVSTREFVIQELDILNFQGNRHSPEEIAMLWKKDCRMWLWKSFRLSRRQNQTQNVE